MIEKFRTFIGVKIDSAVRRRSAEIIRMFQAVPADVKWVEPENLHITLKFLGDVEATEIHRVCETVARVVVDRPSFSFELRGAGAFPTVKRPRTIWLGPGAGERDVVDLAKALEKKLRNLGFPREDRRFSPHLTIGRVRRGGHPGDGLADLLIQNAEVSIGTFLVDEVTVFSSRLTPSGSVYEVLSRARLASDTSGCKA